MRSSRREWILGSLSAIASAREHAHRAAAAPSGTAFEFFDAASAAEIAAMAEQIVPSTDGPGAREAGAIYFVDRALATFDADQRDLYRKGLGELRAARLKLYPASAGLAALPGEQQTEVVRAIEKSDFFEAVRVHTLLGFLGPPVYGGNRGRAGWKHIGFEDRMAWEPPFGYYDAEHP